MCLRPRIWRTRRALAADVVAADIAAITGAMSAIDRLAIELGEQDVSDGVEHGFGSAFEQI